VMGEGVCISPCWENFVFLRSGEIRIPISLPYTGVNTHRGPAPADVGCYQLTFYTGINTHRGPAPADVGCYQPTLHRGKYTQWPSPS
jgi:hypothetical protein